MVLGLLLRLDVWWWILINFLDANEDAAGIAEVPVHGHVGVAIL
jgi:hypothetical protein